jgi:surface polysaccharide O-acyltransferase-like enzyme
MKKRLSNILPKNPLEWFLFAIMTAFLIAVVINSNTDNKFHLSIGLTLLIGVLAIYIHGYIYTNRKKLDEDSE